MPFRGALSFLTLCGFFVICLNATTATPKPKSGPYTSNVVVGLKKCNKTSLPFLKNPAVVVTVEASNTKKSLSIVRGNVTVLRDTNNIKFSIKDYYYEDGKWLMIFNVKNLSCHSQLLAALLKAFDVLYDKKTCNVPKGIYTFEVNYNTLDHLWMPTRDYGRLLRRFEAFTKAGTILCLEYEEIVKPETH